MLRLDEEVKLGKDSTSASPVCLPPEGTLLIHVRVEKFRKGGKKTKKTASVGLIGKLRLLFLLALKGKAFNGMDGLVTGWGATKSGGSTANILQEVTVPIMSNDDCKKTAYGEKRITANMMCAGIAEGGKDSCQVRIFKVRYRPDGI